MANSSFRLQPTNIERHPDREVFAGWDEGIQTYYASVYNGVDANGPDKMDFDVGKSVLEIQTVDELITQLSHYAEIPDGFSARLEGSRYADLWTCKDLRQEPWDDHLMDESDGDSNDLTSGMGY